MENSIPLDELDTRLAETAAALMKAILQAARTRHAADQEAVDQINGLTACRLTVTAVGSQLQVELVGNIEGETKRLFGGTFQESGALH